MEETKKEYAVVVFINENNSDDNEAASEVPSSWLNDEQNKCWWPNSKHVAPHILKKTSPDTKKWELHNVRCVGFYDNVQAARQKADGFSSSDEGLDTASSEPRIKGKENTLPWIKEEGARRRNNVRKNYCVSASEESDDDDANAMNNNKKKNTISSPPKLAIHSLANDTPNELGLQLDENTCNKVLDNSSVNGIKVISNVSSPLQFKLQNVQAKEGIAGEKVDSTLNENINLTLGMESALGDLFIPDQSLLLQQINELRQLQQNLNEKMNDMYSKILEKMGEGNFIMKNVFERLDTIEKAVNVNQLTASGSNENSDLDELLPLQDVKSVEEFEEHILIGDVKQRLVSYLISIGGRSAKECISRMLAKVFGPSAAKFSSWCGQRGNFKVNDLTIIKAVKEAVKSSYTCTDKYFEEEAKEWFRQGTQKYARLQKKRTT